VLVGYLISQNDSEVAGLWSKLDEGGAEILRGNFWKRNQTSDTWFLTDFMECPGAVNALPSVTQRSPPAPPTRGSTRNISHNDHSALSGLLAEILLQIICPPLRQDAFNLRIASRTIAAL
jgi:hypothetical protein